MDSTEGDGLFTGLGGANYQDFRENSRASENGTNSYAAVAGRLPQRNGRQPPPRRPQAPPVAAPMPTHITRTRTLLIDVKAVKPNHDRAERAALLIEDMQLPAATVTDIYMLQVEQLLLVTFSSEVVFQEAMEKLKVGVRWTAACGRLVYGWPTTDSLLQVRITNIHSEVPVELVVALMSRYGRVVQARTVPGRDPSFPAANVGILFLKMAINDDVAFPDFVAVENHLGVLDSILRIFTDNSLKRCYRCGQVGHLGAFCRRTARAIADQPDVWARLILPSTSPADIVIDAATPTSRQLTSQAAGQPGYNQPPPPAATGPAPLAASNILQLTQSTQPSVDSVVHSTPILASIIDELTDPAASSQRQAATSPQVAASGSQQSSLPTQLTQASVDSLNWSGLVDHLTPFNTRPAASTQQQPAATTQQAASQAPSSLSTPFQEAFVNASPPDGPGMSQPSTPFMESFMAASGRPPPSRSPSATSAHSSVSRTTRSRSGSPAGSESSLSSRIEGQQSHSGGRRPPGRPAGKRKKATTPHREAGAEKKRGRPKKEKPPPPPPGDGSNASP